MQTLQSLWSVDDQCSTTPEVSFPWSIVVSSAFQGLALAWEVVLTFFGDLTFYLLWLSRDLPSHWCSLHWNSHLELGILWGIHQGLQGVFRTCQLLLMWDQRHQLSTRSREKPERRRSIVLSWQLLIVSPFWCTQHIFLVFQLQHLQNKDLLVDYFQQFSEFRYPVHLENFSHTQSEKDQDLVVLRNRRLILNSDLNTRP